MNSSNEYLIIGAGLTGLFLTHRLHLAGHKVTLLEARDTLGGRYHRLSPSQPYSSPGLELIPASKEHLAVVEWLKNQAPIPFHFTASEHRPQMYDEGKWRPFVGFGETEFLSVGELSSLYAHAERLEIEPGLEQLTRALIEQLPVEAKTMSEVTGIKITDDRVSEVVVNGETVLRPQNVIFTCPPSKLNALIEGDALAAKHRTRLAKLQSWTAVCLELAHPTALADDTSIRLFSHSAKDFEPVAGQIRGTSSKWMTLIPQEREADHEFYGQCIRHIKRQLKRAWPEAVFTEGSERISIQPYAFGLASLRTKDPFRFPEISNLYMAGHALSNLPGELSSVEVVMNLDLQLCGPLNKLPEISASC